MLIESQGEIQSRFWQHGDMKLIVRLLGPLVCFTALSCAGHSPERKVEETGPRYSVNLSPSERAQHEAWGKEWVVSTQGSAATDAVDSIYKQGGNIIDAAVAASFTISVERPQSTGLGGGGFMLYREAKSGKIYAIDFRERAPKAAHEKVFLDASGEVVPDKSLVGIYAAGVPGLVRGLSEIHRKFGKLDLRKVVKPAVDLANGGVIVYPYLENAATEEIETLKKFPETGKIFLNAEGKPYRVGDRLIQKDLAVSLESIAETKGNSFYSGKIADSIEKVTNGWITRADLAAYRVKWRTPVRSMFHGYEVVSMPPPSSGGVHLIQILRYLESEPLKELGFQSPESIHRIASSMQSAFIDRARYMGDPDYVHVPLKSLLSSAHISELRKNFNPDHALGAEAAGSALPVLPEHSETTHFSIMDRAGNVVVSTQTINGWFGSGIVIPGAGILLNNEMDDFSAKPGASNLFGAVGSKANSVQPGKTPLSSMSPTIVLENGKPRLAVGAPGGTRIITCVAQTILNHLVYGLPLYESVNALRVHEQWKPDVLSVEGDGFSRATEEKLTRLGWIIKKGKAGCAVMAVGAEAAGLHGVSEPRDAGKAFAR